MPTYTIPAQHVDNDPNHTPVHNQLATAAANSRYFIDVRDTTYGAQFDGVTNDTSSLQNALNAAGAAAGTGVAGVQMPFGTAVTTLPLVIPKGVTLRGCGGPTASGDDKRLGYGTVIKPASSFSNPTYGAYATAVILILDDTPGSGGNTNGFRLEDFWI